MPMQASLLYATRCKAGCGAVYKLHDVIYIDTDYTEHTDTEEWRF